MITERSWQRCSTQTFWGEEASCSHVLQIYENEESFLNMLEGFAAGGLTVDDCVVIIATPAHLLELEQRLRSHGLNMDALSATGQYVALNAEEVLTRFMVNEWPDYSLFMDAINDVFQKLPRQNRQVRAFGEMVVLLWEKGNSGATVMLEHLWNAYSEKESFSLFCAYPKSAFPDDANTSLSNICKAHSKIITGSEKSITELSFSQVVI